ncbi:type II toxin-antitoxin system VapB family antitoxin [Streptomyces sp. NPDC101152]|uniref:type II toxin-antitoxin system VapB family antitoxin n=1 Tax=Streptomyces sp. NPDC101152 TaxID=3366116 RepID=UPI0037FBE5F9
MGQGKPAVRRALAEAMRLMGATTKKETMDAALRNYVARVKRLVLQPVVLRPGRGKSRGRSGCGPGSSRRTGAR